TNPTSLGTFVGDDGGGGFGVSGSRFAGGGGGTASCLGASAFFGASSEREVVDPAATTICCLVAAPPTNVAVTSCDPGVRYTFAGSGADSLCSTLIEAPTGPVTSMRPSPFLSLSRRVCASFFCCAARSPTSSAVAYASAARVASPVDSHARPAL